MSGKLGNSEVARRGWLFGLGLLLGGLPLSGRPASDEVRLQAMLVWGTNESRPVGKQLKEVDLKLRERLRNIFKWRNYFEMSRQAATVTVGKSQTLAVSDDSSVQIKILPDKTAEVKLIRKGSTVISKRYPLDRSESLVLAGDDKNDTAWFVVLDFH